MAVHGVTIWSWVRQANLRFSSRLLPQVRPPAMISRRMQANTACNTSARPCNIWPTSLSSCLWGRLQVLVPALTTFHCTRTSWAVLVRSPTAKHCSLPEPVEELWPPCQQPSHTAVPVAEKFCWWKLKQHSNSESIRTSFQSNNKLRLSLIRFDKI